MRLFIAEKPSLARAIAQALPLPQRRYREHLQCGGGNVVAWCVGHILEPVMPEHYDRRYARWSLEDLPIVPTKWRLRATVPALLSSMKMLLRGASRVVHAGDPDREGQLLVDEVLDFLGYEGPVDRILIRDTNPDAVAAALAALEPNAKYRPLGTAALARQRADWLYGINMTRAYSLLGRAAGYDQRVLSVGRVQTPLLGLVARRDAAIAAFEPTAYFVVTAGLRTGTGAALSARWEPAGLGAPDVDESGRVLREEFAARVAAGLRSTEGRVFAVARKAHVEGPPLPYSLADLQIDAARRLGLSAKEVLDACQALYETHRLTTYPRSDCSHLPEGHLAKAKELLGTIATGSPELAPLVDQADASLRSRAWDDRKVTAHHAIVPTRAAGTAALGPTERAVYDLIARRYIGQFLPPHEYAQLRIDLDVGGRRLVASGRETTRLGWRVASPRVVEGEDDPKESSLPALEPGEVVSVAEVEVARRESEAPKAFTDATLMQAMVHVAAHVEDPRVKAVLADADGLGTPATRPAIIETLFERGYVERRGKSIVSTAIGRALVASLPAALTRPDMTAEWEASMRAIAEGGETLEGFLEKRASELAGLLGDAKARRLPPPPPPPPSTGPRAPTASGSRLTRPAARGPKARTARSARR
jgi:DNA topoisomerase III